MLCKDKITSIFCIIDDILKEINHSEDIPPLAQACSLSPIQNSEFTILSPSHLSHLSHSSHSSHLSQSSQPSQPSQSSQLSHIKKIRTLSKVKHKQYTNDTGRAKDKRRISEKLAKIKYLMSLPKLEKHSVLGRFQLIQVIMVTFIFLFLNIDNKIKSLFMARFLFF